MGFIKGDPIPVGKKCFFCDGEVEFQMAETMDQVGIVYRCLKEEITYTITKTKDEKKTV